MASTNSGKHNEIFEQTEMSAVLLKHIKLLNYDLNKKIHWLGNLVELKALIFELFGSSGKWSSPGGYAKSFRNENISVTWYTNKRTQSFHGVLGNSFKELIIDLLKNELSTLAAIPTNVDTNNRSDAVGKYDHDINVGTPNTDKNNSKNQASDTAACLVEDPDLSGSNDGVTKFDCSDGDQIQELVRVKLQIATLHNQVDSLNKVVDSMNVVVESLSKLVIPNEGSNLHSELRLETMLTEFSNILENKNKVIYDLENTIIELEHKLAEVSKDRDELKHNYCLIDGPQQKIYHKNNVNLSPPFMESHVQAVEQINNTPITDANPSCESHHSSKGQNLPTINMSKKRQDNNNNKNGKSHKFGKGFSNLSPSSDKVNNPLSESIVNIRPVSPKRRMKPSLKNSKKSPFYYQPAYYRTRHRQSPNLEEWQNHLKLIHSRTRNSVPMHLRRPVIQQNLLNGHHCCPNQSRHPIITPSTSHTPYLQSTPRPLMEIQYYSPQPLPKISTRKDQLNWFQYYY